MDRKKPTDHLPPAEERAADDDRSTSGHPYPVDDIDEQGGVNPETAAEPDKPNRHGLDKLPPGLS